MDKPGEYDVVHPIWQRGRDWGVQEERKRVVELLHAHHAITHIETPSGVCRACRILKDITGDAE